MLQTLVEIAGTVCDAARLFNIPSNSWSSASYNSWWKTGMSGEQKPHHLLRLRNASTCWRSVAMMNLLHMINMYISRETMTAQKMAYRPISVMPWCCSMLNWVPVLTGWVKVVTSVEWQITLCYPISQVSFLVVRLVATGSIVEKVQDKDIISYRSFQQPSL